MSKRTPRFFRKRGQFSVNPKRPVSMRSKLAVISAFCSFLVLGASIGYAVYTNGDSGRIAGGIGFVFLSIEIAWTIITALYVKNEVEPVFTRVLAVSLSTIAMLVLGLVYVVGVMRG